MAPKTAKPIGLNRPTLGGIIVSQVFVFVFCVLFPGFLTAVAPVSWVKFERNGERVTARAQVCMFFVVPYKTMTVDPVVGIGKRSEADKTRDVRRNNGKRENVTTEGEGFLIIRGPDDQTVEVSVTPVDVKSVAERSTAFLDDPQAKELKLFVVANWKFSVIFGGLMSLLTVLYVVGVGLWIPVTIYKTARRLLRFATGADLAVENFSNEDSASVKSKDWNDKK